MSAAAALRIEGGSDRRGAPRARRRRAQSPGAPAKPNRFWPARGRTRPRFRRAAEAALAERKTIRRQRLQDRTRAPHRRARARARRRRHAASACPRCRPPPSPPFPEFSPMPEIALTPDRRPCPPRLEHRPAAHPPRRRPEGHRRRPLCRRQPSARHALRRASRSSSIARGRVTSLDVAAAKAHPGVVEVMTPANRPALAQDPDAKTNPFMFRLDLLQNDRVRYANQPIAVVIAETLEAATEGAALLAPRYEVEPARVGLDADESFVPPAVGVGNPPKVQRRRCRGRPRRGRDADRRDLRNAGAISQRDGAARDRRGMGRRHAVDRHAEPGPRHGAGPPRRTVRHPAGQHPYPQPVPRRRLRLARA